MKAGKNESAKKATKAAKRSKAAPKSSKRLVVDDLKDVKAGLCTFGDKTGCST